MWSEVCPEGNRGRFDAHSPVTPRNGPFMRKILRGLAVATALSVGPLTVAALPAAPTQAAASSTPQTATIAASSTPVSPAAQAKARRTISVKDLDGPKARLRFTVKPQYGNKPLLIETRKAGKFKRTGQMRTNRAGVAVKTFAGSRRGIRYRVIAPGGRDYSTSVVSFTITRF